MKKYTIVEQQEHLRKWKDSGLSGQGYCRKNNIYPTTFYGWVKREKQRKNKKEKTIQKVVKVQTGGIERINHNQEILIEYCGIKIHIPMKISAEELQKILMALGIENVS